MRRTILVTVMAATLAVAPMAVGHPYNMPLGKGERAIRHAVRRIAEDWKGVESWSVYGCARVRHSHVSCTGRWRFSTYAGRVCTRRMIAYYPNSSPRIKVRASGLYYCSR